MKFSFKDLGKCNVNPKSWDFKNSLISASFLIIYLIFPTWGKHMNYEFKILFWLFLAAGDFTLSSQMAKPYDLT